MSADDSVVVADTHPACRTLGPGTRFAIWVQGCPLTCAGCVSPQWLPFDGGERRTVAELAAEILATDTNGLTLSGGEPFAQAAGLAALVRTVRRERDLSVMCFTGFTLPRLRRLDDAGVAALLGEVDLLVDGPYVASKHGDLRWRGSSNQRIHQLTTRHAADLDGPDHSAGLQIEVLPDGTVHWLGVPAVADFRSRFEQALNIVSTREEGCR
ncbi:4Fe-4S single cluster domain-containing protein [Nocardia bovistercoris]|uniref:Radical SAM protein n=1 Tax=Nocardia bovistercoris TaxID=2785916 RepID=A0A931I924_9NOCA|nr:4Fe-4S single cluster domain-containing protein [Nocardia bovistercoris]MBH0775967.1 radical SAM protein [Nocardia bovistercoris]